MLAIKKVYNIPGDLFASLEKMRENAPGDFKMETKMICLSASLGIGNILRHRTDNAAFHRSLYYL